MGVFIFIGGPKEHKADREVSRRPGGPPHKAHGYSVEERVYGWAGFSIHLRLLNTPPRHRLIQQILRIQQMLRLVMLA